MLLRQSCFHGRRSKRNNPPRPPRPPSQIKNLRGQKQLCYHRVCILLASLPCAWTPLLKCFEDQKTKHLPSKEKPCSYIRADLVVSVQMPVLNAIYRPSSNRVKPRSYQEKMKLKKKKKGAAQPLWSLPLNATYVRVDDSTHKSPRAELQSFNS